MNAEGGLCLIINNIEFVNRNRSKNNQDMAAILIQIN